LKKYILGVGIDDVNLEQATVIVEGWLRKGGKHYIVTPNPEFLVDAESDSEFKKILNEADLSIPDGIGLRINTDIVCNTPGIDLMEALIKLAAEKGFTTGFLGGKDGVAKIAVERLREKYPNLGVSFISSGEDIGMGKNQEVSSSEYQVVSKVSPNTKYLIPNTDLLFVAFGHPKQEKWISGNLNKISVKVAMGVGGSFDYISGKVIRAPKWFRSLGLEWLFRLIIQPWRIKRQLKLLKYVYLIGSSRLRSNNK